MPKTTSHTAGQRAALLLTCLLTCLLTGLLALFLASCASVRLEQGPYVIRDLEIVYSEQEDLSFLFWRLRADADPDLVDFELWQGEDYRPIALDEAPFPAAPAPCGDDHLCFQYQLPGRYTPPHEEPALRSLHAEEGLFAGPEDLGEHRVDVSFDLRPIAVERNHAIDPMRVDGLEARGFRLRRGYEWQLVEQADDQSCAPPSDAAWRPMHADAGEGAVDVDYSWTQIPRCFVARPARRDAPGVVVSIPLEPSAETHWERQSYVPPRIEAPTVYGVLLDLEIPNEARCSRIKSTLLQTIDAAIASRGPATRLGVYTPLSPDTGQPLSACLQDPYAGYPTDKMFQDAEQALAPLPEDGARVLWIYVNNIELPPSDRILSQLLMLGSSSFEERRMPMHSWAIGSNTVLQLFPWDSQTGWRPIEDDTFIADIQAFAANTLPFTTMAHTHQTEVTITLPEGVDDPVAFKVCSAAPVPLRAVGVGRSYYLPSNPSAPWPRSGLPYYLVELEPQVLVPSDRYFQRRLEVVVEVCERFCENRFRNRAGDVFPSWSQTSGGRSMEVCQWSE